MVPYRSILFVPGAQARVDRQGRWPPAPTAVVLDLEDSVPADLKAGARATVAESIARIRARDQPGRHLRPGQPARHPDDRADLEAVVVPGLTGIFVPKISLATDVLRFDALLDHFEERNGVSGLEYIVPVEMIGAIQNAREIALPRPGSAR